MKKHALMACGVVMAWVVCGGAAMAKEARPTPAEMLAELAKKYSIKVEVRDAKFTTKTYHGNVTGDASPAKNLAIFAPILVEEWNLYPTALVKKSELLRIILCTKLAFAGQLRTAIPDYEHNDLYIDIERGQEDELYVRKVIHHEFFHIIDWKDDAVVYGDPKWVLLNAKGFKYGTGGKNAQTDPTEADVTDKYPGFITHYSTSGVEEDKAEIFSHMMCISEYMKAREKKDKVLAAKMEMMRGLIKTFYPEVKDTFWTDSAKIKRPALP